MAGFLEAAVGTVRWFCFGTMTRKGWSIAIILAVIVVFVDGWRWPAAALLAVLVVLKILVWSGR